MSQQIHPSPTYPSSFTTFADDDGYTGAEELAHGQKVVDALATLQLSKLFSLATAGPFGIYGLGEHRGAAGKLYALANGTNYFRSSRSYLALDAGTAYPGGASVVNDAILDYGGGRLMLSSGGGSFVTATSAPFDFGARVEILATYTNSQDLVYSGSNFVAMVYNNGSFDTQILTSTDGAAWAAATGSPGTDGNWGNNGGRLGTDRAGNVLAVPAGTATGSTAFWWSTDHGATFTRVAHGLGNLGFRGPSWDAGNSRWLVSSATSTAIYASTAPGSINSWSVVAGANPTYLGTVNDFWCTPGGIWILTGTSGVIVSGNRGTSWEWLGLGNYTRIARMWRRLGLYGIDPALISDVMF